MEAANQIKHSKIEFSIRLVVVWFNWNLNGCNNLFLKLMKLCPPTAVKKLLTNNWVMQSFIFIVYRKHSVKTFGELGLILLAYSLSYRYCWYILAPLGGESTAEVAEPAGKMSRLGAMYESFRQLLLQESQHPPKRKAVGDIQDNGKEESCQLRQQSFTMVEVLQNHVPWAESDGKLVLSHSG